MEHKFYIFGAHSRARTLTTYIQYLYPGWSVTAYLVNNEEPNDIIVDGIPVIKIGQSERAIEGVKFHQNCPVFLATRGIYHESLTAVAKRLGFHEIYPVTPELDRKLRNEYLKHYYASIGRIFAKIDQEDTMRNEHTRHSAYIPQTTEEKVRIYVAKSVYDTPTKENAGLTGEEIFIQAGAALTDRRLEEPCITDNTGDHISGKNRQYCELTALYWIWKNAREEIVGLEHYRRRFLLPDDWQDRMNRYGIDVILAVPLYVAPSVAENYRSRHDARNWDDMMDYLKRRDPEEHRQAERFFGQGLYSPCNMFIMRKPVLNDLCSWLFPIIDEAAQGKPGEDMYQNRYPGFLSERLISFFFEKNRKRYKMVYADKNFLG